MKGSAYTQITSDCFMHTGRFRMFCESILYELSSYLVSLITFVELQIHFMPFWIAATILTWQGRQSQGSAIFSAISSLCVEQLSPVLLVSLKVAKTANCF